MTDLFQCWYFFYDWYRWYWSKADQALLKIHLIFQYAKTIICFLWLSPLTCLQITIIECKCKECNKQFVTRHCHNWCKNQNLVCKSLGLFVNNQVLCFEKLGCFRLFLPKAFYLSTLFPLNSFVFKFLFGKDIRSLPSGIEYFPFLEITNVDGIDFAFLQISHFEIPPREMPFGISIDSNKTIIFIITDLV